MHAVQALAQPSSAQIALYPPFACVGDEMAIELDDSLRLLRLTQGTLSHRQAVAIAELEQHIDHLSGPQNADFWTDRDRLHADPRWDQVRTLAVAVLTSFGWPPDAPPKNGALYLDEHGSLRNE